MNFGFRVTFGGWVGFHSGQNFGLKVASSKLFILLNIRCGVHPPHVIPKSKRDENFARLVWTNKVFYARALKMFGIAKLDNIFIKKECEKEIIWLVNQVSSVTFNFHFKFALCFKHVFSKLYSLICVYVHFRIQSTTK
jgi:hypothetical protein